MKDKANQQQKRAASQAWRLWLDSDEGEGCNNPDTMRVSPAYYAELTVRLRAAFTAGFEQGAQHAEERAPLFYRARGA